MDDDQHNRLTEPHRSHAAKLAWKRHRSNYNRGNRKKERDNMSKSFYSVAKDLEESLKSLEEATVVKDNIFNLEYKINFNNLIGGMAFDINKDTNIVSISVTLDENSGRGSYRLISEDNNEQNLDTLYNNLKEDIKSIAETVDYEVAQLLNKYGLKET